MDEAMTAPSELASRVERADGASRGRPDRIAATMRILWSDPNFRERMSEPHRLKWEASWLVALQAEINSGASWRAIERRIGISRKSIQDHAFRIGLVSCPSRSSRFGAAWHRAQQ